MELQPIETVEEATPNLIPPEQIAEESTPVATINNYPLMDNVTAIAARQPPIKQPFEWQKHMDAVWQRVNEDNMLLDYEGMKNSIDVRDAASASAYGEQIRARLLAQQDPTQLSNFQKALDVSRHAAENIAMAWPRLTINNTPQQIAANTQRVGEEAADAMSLEKQIADATGVAGVAGMFAQVMIPYGGTAQNLAVQGAINETVGKELVSWKTGSNEQLFLLGRYYKQLPDEDKRKFLVDLWENLNKRTNTGWFSKTNAALVVATVMDPESDYSSWEKFGDALDKASVVLDAIGLGIVGRMAVNLFKGGRELRNAAALVAKAGGKDAAILATARKLEMRGALEIAKEVSGWNGVEALGKLTTASVRAITPQFVTTAPAELQKVIIAKAEQALADLEQTMYSQGKVIGDINDLKRQFDPSVNNGVARMDFDNEKVTVWMKPVNEQNFTTKEAAEAMRKSLDPQGKYGMSVVPDTTNPGFLVRVEKRKEIERELALQEVRLAEEQAKHRKVVEDEAAAKLKAEEKPAAGEKKTPPKKEKKTKEPKEDPYVKDLIIISKGEGLNGWRKDAKPLVDNGTIKDAASLRKWHDDWQKAAKKEVKAEKSNPLQPLKNIDEHVAKLMKENDWVKAPNLADPNTDVVLYRSKSTGWSADEETVRTVAAEKGEAVRAIAVPKEKASILTGAGKPKGSAHQPYIRMYRIGDDNTFTDNLQAALSYHGMDKNIEYTLVRGYDPFDEWNTNNQVFKRKYQGDLYEIPEDYHRLGIKSFDAYSPQLLDDTVKTKAELRDISLTGRTWDFHTEPFFHSDSVRESVLVEGLHVTKGVSLKSQLWVQRLGNLLVPIDKEHPLIVTTWDDVAEMDALIQGSDTALVADKIRSRINYHMFREEKEAGGSDAFFSYAWNYERKQWVPIIVMNGTTKGKGEEWFLTVFAHEYGHFFEWAWTNKYRGPIEDGFKEWMVSKGYATADDLRNINLATLMQYRSYSSWSATLEEFKRLPEWKGSAFDLPRGGAEDWLPDARLMASLVNDNGWLTKFDEFWAENFSKWAFSDEVPTTILGQAFKGLIDNIKQMFNVMAHMLGEGFRWEPDTILGAFKNGRQKMPTEELERQMDMQTFSRYRKLLNDHVKKTKADIEKNRKQGKPGFWQPADNSWEVDARERRVMPTIPSRSGPLTTTSETATRIEALRAELKAMDDAETGLTHGWLVKGAFQARTNAKYDPEDIASIMRINLGDWALGTSSEQYADRLIGTFKQDRIRKVLTDLVRPAVEKLSRAERVAVDNILIKGDELGKEFDYAELAGEGLSAKAMEAYFTFRAARNITYRLRNDALARSLSGWGYRTILNPSLPDRTFGREAKGQVSAWKADEAKSVSTSEKWRKDNGDYVVYELAQPKDFGGGEVWHVAVKRSETKSYEIVNAIPYRPGEYKRIYTDPYFIKIKSGAYKDKTGGDYMVPHRTATTKQEAEQYIAAFKEGQRLHKTGALTQQKAAELMEQWGWKADEFMQEVGTMESDAELVSVYTRTEDDYVQEGIHLGLNLGKKRGDEALKHVRGDTNTLSPLDSLSAEITNTSYVASVTDWRDNHIKLWYNTFYEHLSTAQQSMSPEDAFFNAMRYRKTYAGADHMLLSKQRVEDYLLQQLNVPTREEQWMQGMGRMTSEIVTGKLPDTWATHKLGAALRQSGDFPKWMRTISFHSYFGFNPVQILVQGMNAFNAVAISPVHGLKAAQVAPLYRLALMSDNPDIWRQVATVNKISTLGVGMDVDEFVQAVHNLRRSGLLDGINSTSLYGAETGKLGLFNKPLRATGEASAWFFNRGEEFSRIVSWDIARREHIISNPNSMWFADDNLAKIMKRQDDLTQNMTQANTAFWQKGALSIPLQFVQYQVKLLMNVMAGVTGSGRALTRGESVRLLMTHMLMMGMAGSWLFDWQREALGELSKDWTPEQRLYLQQGVAAGVINTLALAASGEKMELAIGRRFGTFNFYEDFVDALFEGEKGAVSVLAGASGGAIARATDNFSKALTLFTNAPLTTESFQEGAKLMLAGSFSVVNNYTKAQLAQAWDAQVSKGGDLMYSMTKKEQFMQSWGIPPAAQEDLAILYKSKKERADYIKRESEIIGRWRAEALAAILANDDKKFRMYQAAIQIKLDSAPDVQTRLELERQAYKVEPQTLVKRHLSEILYKQFGSPNDVIVNNNPVNVR